MVTMWATVANVMNCNGRSLIVSYRTVAIQSLAQSCRAFENLSLTYSLDHRTIVYSKCLAVMGRDYLANGTLSELDITGTIPFGINYGMEIYDWENL